MGNSNQRTVQVWNADLLKQLTAAQNVAEHFGRFQQRPAPQPYCRRRIDQVRRTEQRQPLPNALGSQTDNRGVVDEAAVPIDEAGPSEQPSAASASRTMRGSTSAEDTYRGRVCSQSGLSRRYQDIPAAFPCRPDTRLGRRLQDKSAKGGIVAIARDYCLGSRMPLIAHQYQDSALLIGVPDISRIVSSQRAPQRQRTARAKSLAERSVGFCLISTLACAEAMYCSPR